MVRLTGLVCGFLACDGELLKPVLAGLPRVVRVNIRTDRSGEWLDNMLQHAVSQAAASTPGSEVILAHLAEVLFTEVLRRYLLALPEGRTGWLAGAGDPAVGRALAALHREPTFAWTLDLLAQGAGISRSALTEKFTRFIGQAPMAYLTDWRLELGAEALRSNSRSVQRVALDSGYESEAAFNRAFKRRFGVPPARYRREARAAVAEKIPPRSRTTWPRAADRRSARRQAEEFPRRGRAGRGDGFLRLAARHGDCARNVGQVGRLVAPRLRCGSDVARQ